MSHYSSRTPLATRVTRRLTAERTLIFALVCMAALGTFLLSWSSVSVYSSSIPRVSDRSVASNVEPSVPIFDARANSRDFTKQFSGKDVSVKLGRKQNHRLGSRSMLTSAMLPAIMATKTDALFVDVNNDNIANPGDTIRYTVVITNSGSTDATGVMFSDTPDANTTVVPGSETTTPIAIDDSYTATGNVRISVPAPGVLGNDSDADGNTFTASAGATSTNGGNVAMNANGSFTYNPAPGFEGSDSFNYTITDTQGNTDGGTVNITVSGMIWFIDSSAAPGDGRLTSPYNCLVGAGCYFPAAPDDPGDNIFLYSGNYIGGVTLQANQKLIGQGSSVPLALVAGITPAPNSDPLPPTGGANPVITTVAAGTNAINLGSNNLLRGFTVADTTGTDISGTGFGTLTVREVLVNGLGQALNLATGTMDADFGIVESVNSSGTGVTLSGASGTLIAGSTNIQNPAGAGISISTLGAGIPGVNFNNTVVSGSGGTGVSLSGNTGSVTFADLDITPDAGQRGLQATNGAAGAGAITITSGTITTATAVGVDILGFNAANLTPISIVLDSVSTTGPTAAGINLQFTDGPGGFTVQGSGTTAGSGGTITNTDQGAVFNTASNITLKNMIFTNANTLDGGAAGNCDGTTNINCKAAVNMQTVTGTNLLDGLTLTQGVEDGINLRTVSNLTINNTIVQNFGNLANEGPVRAINLTGTSALTNSTFRFGFARVVDIQTNAGSLNLTVDNSNFTDTQTSASGADGLFVRSLLTANVAVNVTNSSFRRIRTVGFNGGATSGTAVLSANITTSTFDRELGIGRAVDLTADASGVMSFNVNNNPLLNSNGGTAVTATALTSSSMQGRINNNPNIQAGGGTTSGSGIQVQVANFANGIVEISNNTISNIGVDAGITTFARQRTLANPPGGRLDVTITNNVVVASPVNSTYAIITRAGSTATDANTVCANVATNTTTPGSIAAYQARVVNANSNLILQGFNTNATTTWNNNGNTPINSVDDTGVTANITGGTCNVPSHPNALNYSPFKPDSNLAKAPAQADKSIKSLEAIQRSVFASAKSLTVITPAVADHAETSPSKVSNRRSIGTAKQSERKNRRSVAHHVVRATPVTANMVGSVNLNIGTLPAGESVTITFDVTINNPMSPTNTTQVANQGTVSGTNFSPVLTDDPDTGAPNDPTVTPVVNPNNNPDAVDDAATVAEDSGANAINVLANDTTAPDTGETLTITAVTQGTNGSVAITGGGTGVTYTPNADFFGSDSFTYTVDDGNGGTDTATVNVTVTEVNDAPTAVDDAIASIAEDSGPYTIPFATLTGNDSKGPANESGQTLTITAVGNAVGGTVMISGTDVVFTPTPNYNGPASFDYTVEDNGTTNGVADPKTDVGSVSFTITAVNDNPDAVDDAATVAEDSGANTINVLANDSFAPDTGETLTITAVTQGANGSVAITGGGTTVSYTPNANFAGSDSFTYTISDGNGGTDTATVNITVTNVNDNPTANDDAATVAEDSGANTINVLANDTAAPDAGETLTVTAVTQGANGSVAITGGGTAVSYTPNANFFGSDSFTYTISDGNGGTDTATVNITVTNVNDNPTANDDAATVAEDSGANTINVLANDTFAPDTGETLTITAVTQGANGSVAITGGGTTVSYTPNADFFGSDSFTYTISDGNGGTDTATVNITVTNVNDNPTANDDAATVAEDSGANTINVLANDTAAPDAGETLTITAVTQGANGSVAITGGGTTVSYTPNANFFGSDSFTYTISDGNGGTDTATVNITVTNVNDPPDAVNDAATVVEDSGANTINVLANDSFAPDAGETLTITAVTQGANGSVAITGGGTTVSYTPNANYFGPDSFTYTISDGNGGTDTATVSITVTPVNDAPVANAGPDQTVGCTAGVVTLDGTASSDVDDNSSTLTYVWREGSTIIATGPNPTVVLPVGVHTITLTVTDPHGASSQDTVVITVVDDSNPIITLKNVSISLWPPNHQYHTINLTDLVLSASDSCDPTVDINDVVIAVVTSDEVENGNGDGNTNNDIIIGANCKSVQLRAERNGSGDGRVYSITFRLKDTAGNTSTATAKVTVPKSQNGAPAVDSGPHYTVNGTCP